MTAPVVVSGTLAFDEAPELVARALESAAGLAGAFEFGGELITGEHEEAAARQVGMERAQAMGADWYVQLDADEYLVNAELLPGFLEHWPGLGFPLPYVQEGGWVAVAPCKCVRTHDFDGTPTVCAAASDVYRFGELVYAMSGYTFPERYLPVLERLPHSVHTPSARPDATTRRRLSATIEGTGERPAGWRQYEPFELVPRARRLRA